MPLAQLQFRHEVRHLGLRVVCKICRADEPRARVEMQRHAAAQMDRARKIAPRWEQDLPAARVATSVDGGLNRGGVERCTIALRAS